MILLKLGVIWFAIMANCLVAEDPVAEDQVAEDSKTVIEQLMHIVVESAMIKPGPVGGGIEYYNALKVPSTQLEVGGGLLDNNDKDVVTGFEVGEGFAEDYQALDLQELTSKVLALHTANEVSVTLNAVRDATVNSLKDERQKLRKLASTHFNRYDTDQNLDESAFGNLKSSETTAPNLKAFADVDADTSGGITSAELSVAYTFEIRQIMKGAKALFQNAKPADPDNLTDEELQKLTASIENFIQEKIAEADVSTVKAEKGNVMDVLLKEVLKSQLFKSYSPRSGQVKLGDILNGITEPLSEEETKLTMPAIVQIWNHGTDQTLDEEAFEELQKTEQRLRSKVFTDIATSDNKDGIQLEELVSFYRGLVREKKENIERVFKATASKIFPETKTADLLEEALDETGFGEFYGSLVEEFRKYGQSSTLELIKKDMLSRMFKSFRPSYGDTIEFKDIVNGATQHLSNEKKNLQSLVTEQMDTYGNGKIGATGARQISKLDFAQLKQNEQRLEFTNFNDIDTNGDDFIERQELVSFYEALIDEQQKQLEQIDPGEQTLTLEEFETFIDEGFEATGESVKPVDPDAGKNSIKEGGSKEGGSVKPEPEEEVNEAVKLASELLTEDIKSRLFQSYNPVDGLVPLKALADAAINQLSVDRPGLERLAYTQVETFEETCNGLIEHREFFKLQETERRLKLKMFEDVDADGNGSFDEQELLSFYEEQNSYEVEIVRAKFSKIAADRPDISTRGLDAAEFENFMTSLVQNLVKEAKLTTLETFRKVQLSQLFQSYNPVDGFVQLKAIVDGATKASLEEQNELNALATEQMKKHEVSCDGKLDESEFIQLQEIEAKLTSKTFGEVDANGDGGIGQKELASFYAVPTLEQIKTVTKGIHQMVKQIKPVNEDKLSKKEFEDFINSVKGSEEGASVGSGEAECKSDDDDGSEDPVPPQYTKGYQVCIRAATEVTTSQVLADE